jgi:hypothetical protein
MRSYWGVEHGEVSKLYSETRPATPQELNQFNTKYRSPRPRKVLRFLPPKPSKRPPAKSGWAYMNDESRSNGMSPLITEKPIGSAKKVKNFSSYVAKSSVVSKTYMGAGNWRKATEALNYGGKFNKRRQLGSYNIHNAERANTQHYNKYQKGVIMRRANDDPQQGAMPKDWERMARKVKSKRQR